MSLMRVGSRVTALGQKIGEKIVLPERLKDTFLEKWVKYWKGLVRDYSEVAVGVVKESYTKPKKALVYGTGILCLYQVAKHNPDDGIFMTQLRRDNSRMIMVPPELYNHVSAKHLLMLERAINQKKLRFLSLGICTLVWVDLFGEDDCTYPALCEFTNVGFLNFYQRVIDVGFWNEFWYLKWKMHNYDVNYL